MKTISLSHKERKLNMIKIAKNTQMITQENTEGKKKSKIIKKIQKKLKWVLSK